MPDSIVSLKEYKKSLEELKKENDKILYSTAFNCAKEMYNILHNILDDKFVYENTTKKIATTNKKKKRHFWISEDEEIEEDEPEHIDSIVLAGNRICICKERKECIIALLFKDERINHDIEFIVIENRAVYSGNWHDVSHYNPRDNCYGKLDEKVVVDIKKAHDILMDNYEEYYKNEKEKLLQRIDKEKATYEMLQIR